MSNTSPSNYSPISHSGFVKTKAGKYRLPKSVDKDQLLQMVVKLVEEDVEDRYQLSSAEAAKHYLHLKLAHLDYETFHAVYLDSQHQVLGMEQLFRGTLNQSPVGVLITVLMKTLLLSLNGIALLAHPPVALLSVTTVLCYMS